MNSSDKMITAIIAVGLLFIVTISLFLSPTPPTEAQKLAQLVKELNAQITNTNSGISATISQAKYDLLIAEAQVKRYTQCIAQNEAIITENSQMTLSNFSSGGLKQSLDCTQISLLEEEVLSTETLTSTWTATGAINPVPVRVSRVPLKPSELFYTSAVYDRCHISQWEEQHYLKKNGWVLATDVACRFDQPKAQRSVVYAPDYLGESLYYKITNIGNDKLLWDYIELTTDGNKVRWIIAHIETKKRIWDIIQTGEVLGQQNLSGSTTGYHTHIELWKYIDGKLTNVSYSTRSIALINRRQGSLDTTVAINHPIYATQYNLGDVNQNDASPFIGASGKDLQHVKNPIALTADVRKLYSIKFGDKVQLNGPCSDIYQVEDEMNIRFRSSCILKEGGCIKADIAIQPNEKKNCSGTYYITKL